MLRRLVLLAAALLLCLTSASASLPVHVNEEPPEDWESRNLLRLYAFSSYRSDALVIECGGETLAVDGSLTKYYEKLMAAYEDCGFMKDGHPHIDRLFNTHPDNDHIQGLYVMLRHGLTTNEFLSTFRKGYQTYYQKMCVATLEKYNVPYRRLEQNEVLRVGDAEVTAFWWQEGTSTNYLSGQLHVRFGDATILLTGDATGLAQRALLEQVGPELLEADILKMPHHGLTACVPEFLEAVDPAYAIITHSAKNEQTGCKNAVRQLKNRGVPYSFTYQGRIVCETDGKEWYVRQYTDKY